MMASQEFQGKIVPHFWRVYRGENSSGLTPMMKVTLKTFLSLDAIKYNDYKYVFGITFIIDVSFIIIPFIDLKILIY